MGRCGNGASSVAGDGGGADCAVSCGADGDAAAASGCAFLRDRPRRIRAFGGGSGGAGGRDAGAVAGDGAGDLADAWAHASGGGKRDRTTVRQRDLVLAGGKIYCAVRVVSPGGAGVSRRAPVAAVRDVFAGGAGLSLLHGNRVPGGREVTDLSALHFG